MNRTIQAILGFIFVLIIAFSAIVIFQCIGRNAKIDVTEQSLYTLTDGTRSILNKLNQPVKLKLYYAKKATLKASDQIKFFNTYYEYVRSLLEEYVSASGGKVKLEIIDPRPYSDSEVQALRYGLQKFPITEEENFFFGLVLQTPFGVEKVIPFFSPDRQSFIEYDISSLIDSAITREKSSVGVLSSISVMGDDTSDYMVQMMRMQGQQPKGPWTAIEQLKQKYNVVKIDNDTADINDVDILLVVHPKKLPVQTQFAIDQFVLRGGRTIVCVDPHSIVDQPSRMQMQMKPDQTQSSELDVLLNTWGLEMPADTLAGDRSKALITTGGPGNSRGQKMIGFLQLDPPECFNPESIITGNLNQVRVLFAGVLNEIPLDPNDQGDIERTPLLMTTDIGNSWSPELPVDLMLMNPARLMNLFSDGTKPVNMGYLVTGKFKSGFPKGVEYEPKTDPSEPADPADPNEGPKTIKLTGLSAAQEDCAVVVFSDVDFISDIVAYQESIFGKMVVGDNASLLMNTVDYLGGSADLISIRSRGNFKRPFDVVDRIEKQAAKDTADEEASINAEIEGFQKQLTQLLTSSKEQQDNIIGSSILDKKREVELKIREAEQKKLEVQRKRVEKIDKLGRILQNANILSAPGVILVIAIILGIRRTMKKRHYISHASDS